MRDLPLNDDDHHFFNEVYLILVRLAGVPDNVRERRTFVFSQPVPEYWIVGHLGVGSRLVMDDGRIYVTAPPDDDDPRKASIVEKTNAELAELLDRRFPRCVECQKRPPRLMERGLCSACAYAQLAEIDGGE